MTRIRIVASAVLLVLATSLAAPLGVSAQSAPIKIGFLAPLTGPFAQIGQDMVNGNQLYLATIGGFQQVFEEGGGQIVQRIWAPLNTNDFAPFLAQIRRDADAVLALFTGRLALQFVKQYEEAGLKGKLPLLGGGTITDETVLPQMGDEAIGLITALHYSQALDNPANAKFNKAFEASAGKIPSYYSEATYTNP